MNQRLKQTHDFFKCIFRMFHEVKCGEWNTSPIKYHKINSASHDIFLILWHFESSILIFLNYLKEISYHK